MHKCVFFLFIVSSLLIVFPAKSPCFENWPSTGQDKCYDNQNSFTDYHAIDCPDQRSDDFFGQDNQYSSIQPPRSYTKLDIHGNPLQDSAETWVMIRDNVTGLTWEIKQEGDEEIDYSNPQDADNIYGWCDPSLPSNQWGVCGDEGVQDTNDFLRSLNMMNYHTGFGGFNDWRLPTIKELSTLPNASMDKPSVDLDYFPNTIKQSAHYWTSTTVTNNVHNAWVIWFQLGNIYNDKAKTNSYYVRAVRSPAQDNPEPKFSDNRDGTITDNSTGLVWQNCSMGQTYNSSSHTCENPAVRYSWKQALRESEELSLANHNDWRLPNRLELLSLADYAKPTQPATLFPGPTEHFGYWSSTSHVWHTWRAWYIHFSHGNLFSTPKLEMHGNQSSSADLNLDAEGNPIPEMMYVRSVRGRQTVKLSVEIKGKGTGSVTSQPGNITCPGNCEEKEIFHAGDQVTLTAVADPGFTLTGWLGGDCVGTGPCTILMNQDKTVTAIFGTPFSWTSFLPAIFHRK